MKISFYNIGCKVNFAETSTIAKQMETLGAEVVEFGEDVDAVLINTCTVTNNADADCRKIIRRALRKSPDAFVGVMGCYAQLNSDAIAEIDGVDAIFGTEEKFNIPEYIEDWQKRNKPLIVNDKLETAEFHAAMSADDASRTRVFVKIQDGCDYVCTYCAVSHARGPNRSLPFDEIPKFFEKFKSDKYREIILSGINLGEYSSGDKRFADVVNLIDELKIVPRVRISSIEPNLLKEEIIRRVADSKTFCPHFHIPLQSGSDEILALMKRRYKSKTFLDLVRQINEIIPDCCIGVDVIAGFPGETDACFRQSYDLLESLPISYLHVFTYSERENTPAAEYGGRVDPIVRKERTKALRALSDKKRDEFHDSQIGRILTVIPEQISKKTGLWTAWTENYVHTEFEGPAGIEGTPMKAKMIERNGMFVRAELIV
ncbi:MAG: tRNA (N(6)-L-threonylcarbamoyladenosine(37)-C(2))-methylthiotransferase MtaB [Candidatus Kapabacteria bacterium]|jgi:threonylcarbamoyladenosine tRNA methylthiotransferase MtaB|nr:tRNA (N(6)-L-threonylcarbamoyladenosine(37)-C(2))-methylthiotransferase MtaB [Candidatus Kapabacteria bacterium]